MSQPWNHLPGPARLIAVATGDAVDAAVAADLGAFEPAAAQLAALDPEPVGRVLGAVVRALLEDLHPDGLAGEDIRLVLEGCLRHSVWLPGLDPGVLLVLLTGALGVHHPSADDRPPPGPAAVARHAPVLIADLLAGTGRPLAGYLAAAFAEIARAETMEAP